MSDKRRTKKVLEERDKRILQHARNGCKVLEICDIEGMDKRNPTAVADIIKAGGAVPLRGPSQKLAVGLADIPVKWRVDMGSKLYELVKIHPQPVVSSLVGLTNAEIKQALKQKHNWTIAQLQRLATALSISFHELIKI